MPAMLDMLRQYRDHTPLGFLKDIPVTNHGTQIISTIMAGKGVALVAEVEGVVQGMLLSSISPSLWSPAHYVMTELVYWVNPEARGTTAGHRLLKAYVEHGQALKDQGRISAFFVSKMANSPDLNYGRFGFSKIEEFWGI